MLLPVIGHAQLQNGLEENRIQFQGVWYTLFTDAEVATLDLKKIDCLECLEILIQQDSIHSSLQRINRDQSLQIANSAAMNDNSLQVITSKSILLEEEKSKNLDLNSENKKLKIRNTFTTMGAIAVVVLTILAK